MILGILDDEMELVALHKFSIAHLLFRANSLSVNHGTAGTLPSDYLSGEAHRVEVLMPKISFALALAAMLSAPFLAAPARASVVLCSPVRLNCGNQAQPDDPPLLLLPGANLDIGATVLSILLAGTLIHPAVSTVPFTEPHFGHLRRAIAIDRVLEHNRELLLLHGKRRCINCVLFNSFDRRFGR